jgi:hypothetical protein
MNSIEALRKQLRKIAASTHGQTENVRTIQGRQMFFLNHQQAMFLLPHLAPTDGGEQGKVQVKDPNDVNFGKFYVLVDVDPVDSGTSIIK